MLPINRFRAAKVLAYKDERFICLLHRILHLLPHRRKISREKCKDMALAIGKEGIKTLCFTRSFRKEYKITFWQARLLGSVLCCEELFKLTPTGKNLPLTNFISVSYYVYSLFSGITNEAIFLIYVNESMRVVNTVYVDKSNINKVNFDGNRPYKGAPGKIKHALFIAHNHTNDDATPSKTDAETTKTLYYKLLSHNILLLDSLIVSGNTVSSILTGLTTTINDDK